MSGDSVSRFVEGEAGPVLGPVVGLVAGPVVGPVPIGLVVVGGQLCSTGSVLVGVSPVDRLTDFLGV